MIIKATNDSGTITIEAGKGLERTYRWDDVSAEVKMLRRDKRWFGSLGIYSPGGGGKIHTVLEEGQQHFYSEDEALEWLTWQNDRMHYVYSTDGLVVGWYKTNNTLSVQVWQFYISGKRPMKLLGATEDLVAVSFKDGLAPEPIKAGNFQPSSPKMINGRRYSGKSIDIMSDKGITADKVEICITEGKSWQEGKHIHYSLIDKTDYSLLWVILDTQHRVVLVGN